MRATAFLVAAFVALVTAAPQMAVEKIAERELCVSATMSHPKSIQASCLGGHTLAIWVSHELCHRFAPKTAARALIAAPMALAGWQPQSGDRLGVGGHRERRLRASGQQKSSPESGAGLRGLTWITGVRLWFGKKAVNI